MNQKIGFNHLIPTIVQIWNPTDQKIEFGYDAKTIILEPNEMLDVTEQAAKDVHTDNKHKGLVVIRRGDSPEQKKKESKLAIYECLFKQLKLRNSYKDEQRNDGKTLIGEFSRITQIKREMSDIEDALELEKRLDTEFYKKYEREKEASASLAAPKRGRKPLNVNTGTTTAAG